MVILRPDLLDHESQQSFTITVVAHDLVTDITDRRQVKSHCISEPMLCKATPCHAIFYAILFQSICNFVGSFWRKCKLIHAIPCYVMLLHVMICYAMLCHAMPCYAMLCYAMPCHAMPCHAMPCHAMPCYVMLFHALIVMLYVGFSSTDCEYCGCQ